MTSNERFVIDTNVVVSAVLSPRSIPRQAFDLAFTLGSVLASDSTLAELDHVLRRPKFSRYITEDERLKFLVKFIQDATIIEITMVVTDCRDPKDNKFLELALSGSTKAIISGDADLASLHPFRKISIFTPKLFASVRS
ncbi:MAG: putative toxin-antitoxin system toxin component, PIN family [Cyanobacteria bacterium J06627_32]